MKKMLYPSLAFEGIKKNKQIYFPYLLTSVLMVAMFYVMHYLSFSLQQLPMRGGSSIAPILGFGMIVVGVFALIFLFYTHGFLLRRRTKEFGLYHILGMSKRQLAIITFFDTLYVFLISIVVGLLMGMLVSKGAELLLLKLIHAPVNFSINIYPDAFLSTLAWFGVFHLVLLIQGLWALRKNALELSKTETVGEKPVKANYVLALIGLTILSVAYFMAVTIQEPLAAFQSFFIAVILVIIATYFLLIAGSVALCKVLQKNKSYYYQADHFVSVSSMAYRMKRNGAGLASVCILATMVLVIISSTTCLYFGAGDLMDRYYSREYNAVLYMDDVNELYNVEQENERLAYFEKQLEASDIHPQNLQYYAAVQGYAYKDQNIIYSSTEHDIPMNVIDQNTTQIFFISLQDYNRLTQSQETLKDDEALVYLSSGTVKDDSWLFGGIGIQVKQSEKELPSDRQAALSIYPSMYVVMNDVREISEAYAMNYEWFYNFDEEFSIQNSEVVFDMLKSTFSDNGGSLWYETRTDGQEDYFLLYGGILFLGVILSFIFIVAAVLIIYYKQVSEGYEDQKRFDIMKKVGMSQKEIRRTINSQLLTVFYIPLLLAGCHLAFAFPMVSKLMMLFQLRNISLFVGSTVITYLVFAACYAIVYRLTGNVYYRIVSGMKES